MYKMLLLLIGCLSAQTYSVDSNTLYEIDILNVTYISPALETNTFTNHKEHSALLKLSTLISEVTTGIHPQHRTDKILNIIKTYVQMNKTREEKITLMNREMEVYLGTRKTK